jgi:hypothetical protein
MDSMQPLLFMVSMVAFYQSRCFPSPRGLTLPTGQAISHMSKPDTTCSCLLEEGTEKMAELVAMVKSGFVDLLDRTQLDTARLL